MTILILKSGDLTVATNAWTATDYRGSKVQIHFTGSLRCVNLDLTLDEFLGMIEVLGRQADLRKYQLEIAVQKTNTGRIFPCKGKSQCRLKSPTATYRERRHLIRI